jgi:hypothetical protein
MRVLAMSKRMEMGCCGRIFGTRLTALILFILNTEKCFKNKPVEPNENSSLYTYELSYNERFLITLPTYI